MTDMKNVTDIEDYEAQLARIREMFSHDRFATEAAGITIVEARPQYARCEMVIQPVHRNAMGAVMGGAIFTLADLVVAVASNGYKEKPDTVALHADITFLSGARGEKLIAEANCLKNGRTTNLYEVKITDELGTLVAQASINGFVTAK